MQHGCHCVSYFVFISSRQWLSSWWRNQMELFSALLALCAGNSPVTGEFPAQKPVTRSFDIFFHLCLNKRLSKQSWGWWRHRADYNVIVMYGDFNRTIKLVWMLCERKLVYKTFHLFFTFFKGIAIVIFQKRKQKHNRKWSCCQWYSTSGQR